MTDLVSLLRSYGQNCEVDGMARTADHMRQSADEIERLCSELERARKALTDIAQEGTQWTWPLEADGTEALSCVAVQMRQLASAALAEIDIPRWQRPACGCVGECKHLPNCSFQ